MELLVEVKVENDLPVNGTWTVPSLSAVDLLPVVYLLGREHEVEYTEENVFRATKDDAGKISLEFPMSVENFGLLRFCIVRIINGMISAVLDTAWSMEVYNRISKAKESGLVIPKAGPLKL